MSVKPREIPSGQIGIWQEIIRFLEDNKDKHFADNIVYLGQQFQLTRIVCECEDATYDPNGRCNVCSLIKYSVAQKEK